LSHCCGRYHGGEAAPSPEALMRSRYTAFVRHNVDYLLATWHPDTRPHPLDLAGSPDWASLRILSSGEQGDKGTVHFQAIYRTPGGWGVLEEHSQFRIIGGRWYYLTGTTTEGALKPGRNGPCPCGSGRKYKACCQP
jgi:SEC-C motif-containing protein